MKAHVLYRMYNVDDELLYVGITNDPKARFRTHSKLKDWWSEVDHIRVETFGSRDALAAAEMRAIDVERPRYNVIRPRTSIPAAVAAGRCPTCYSPSPEKVPLEEEELLDEDGTYIPFCTDPFHFPGMDKKSVQRVHENRDLLRKVGLLRLSKLAEERLERHRAAMKCLEDMYEGRSL